jgi:hypothetical protein
MQYYYNLVLKSEGEVLLLSMYRPLTLNLNFYGAIGDLSEEQMFNFYGVNPNLFL